MRVVGSLGKYVGFVKQIDKDFILVGRPQQEDLRIPLSAGRMVSDDEFVLDVPAQQADDLNASPLLDDSWMLGSE